jgi:AraC-like DNA-binding protein
MPGNTAQSSKSFSRLHKAVSGLETPKDLFAGLSLKNGFVPDNILLFSRTHTRAFTPGGVNNNFHHRFELVVVVKKSGSARIGNQSYLLEPGEAVLIFPNQFHHYMDVDKGDLEWLFITFELGDPVPIESLRDNPRVLGREVLRRIEKVVVLFSEARETGKDNCLDLSYELSCILKEMLNLPGIDEERINMHSTDDNRDILLEKINEAVRRNLHHPVPIDALAGEMGYSVSYLRAVFRDKLGISLGRYIRDSRLSLAAQLLLRNEHSVTQVAERTGFDSLETFSRAFKNTYGTSPKAYSKLTTR